MLMTVLAGAVGLGVGLLLRMSFFSETGGASLAGALGLAVLTWPVTALGLVGITQAVLGPVGVLPWIGGATVFFAGGLFYGVKRSATR